MDVSVFVSGQKTANAILMFVLFNDRDSVTVSSIELVNAVGGGDLHIEFDLDELSKSINTPVCRYDPEYHPSLYVRFDEEGATILIFRTGKYNITGAESVNKLYLSHEKLIHRLSNIGVDVSKANDSFELRNLVFVNDLETEFDLAELTVGLGIENSEYEPEQFPGLQFNIKEKQGVFLIFSNGKVILTGVDNQKSAESSFSMLKERLNNIGAM